MKSHVPSALPSRFTKYSRCTSAPLERASVTISPPKKYGSNR